MKHQANSFTVLLFFISSLSLYAARTFNIIEIQPPPAETKKKTTVAPPTVENLEDIVVSSGVIDIAKERETPVAVSTIREEEIETKLGNLEFPEIVRKTPSVYVTKQGGGYGDSRINVRGFNQRNTAVLINGQPVNDMENGWVYWSNWVGLQDIASAVQIQRGLGSSKLAVPSVGGTINVVTKSTEKSRGGFTKVSFGNDGYFKGVVGYNTGLGKRGWSVSFLLSGWRGDGYVDGTKGLGVNYYFAVGYKPSAKHTFNYIFTGAAQWHHQRSFNLTAEDVQNYGRKYNADWGYLGGKEYSLRRNFYHKPIQSINWDWKISDKLSLATVIYASSGRGGGTGPRGANYEVSPYKSSVTDNLKAPGGNKLDHRDPNTGLIQFDEIVNKNKAVTPYAGSNSRYAGLRVGSNNSNDENIPTDILIRRASINSHDWYGAIINLKWNINERWNLGGGFDGRIYQAYHYRVVNDLLGLDAYYSTGNKNSDGNFVSTISLTDPLSDITSSTKIDYYNVGRVNWAAGNLLLEYKTEKLSAVLQGGLSNQWYQRVDFFDQLEKDAVSEIHEMIGGYVKGGANLNISRSFNTFFNIGYIARQPNFDAVFPNYGNTVNKGVTTEKIFSVELGIGYTSTRLKANINSYRTTWTDRWLTKSATIGQQDGTATFSGIAQEHWGLELDAVFSLIENRLRITGMLSLGDWKYAGDTEATVFDDNRNQIGKATQYLDGVKVGDAAQFTSSLGVDYTIWKGLTVDISMLNVDNLYADLNPLGKEFENKDKKGSAVKLPSYMLFDAGLSYKLPFNDSKNSLVLRLNVNNVFDTFYYSEANTNLHSGAGVTEINGINNKNQVWVGFGRTWNVSLRLNF